MVFLWFTYDNPTLLIYPPPGTRPAWPASPPSARRAWNSSSPARRCARRAAAGATRPGVAKCPATGSFLKGRKLWKDMGNMAKKKHEKNPENHEQWWFVDEKTVGKSWTMGKSLKHMGKHPINWSLNAKSWENMGNPRTQCWRVSTRYKLILTIVNLVNLLDTYRP